MSEDKYKIIFAKNLKYYLNYAGKTQTDLINDLKLSSSTVSNWCTAQKMPRMDKMQMLASYLGIDKADLIEDKQSIGSPELSHLLKVCDTGYKSVLTWTKDSFYQEYEQLALLDHFSNFLYQYKGILEAVNQAKLYWSQNKHDLIEFYHRRDASLTAKQIKEMFLRQELEDKLNYTSNLISNMSGYIANIEAKYEHE